MRLKMKQKTPARWKTELMLFLAPLIWGASFAVTKGSLGSIGPNWLIAYRFLFAAVFITLLERKKIVSVNRITLFHGFLAGLFLYLVQLTQTVGMLYTTAGRSAFLTATYVVMTPFVVWIVYRQRPLKRQFAGGVLSLIGVGLISLNHEGIGMGRGEILTLLAGLICAVSYVQMEVATEKCEVGLLCWLQMMVCAVLSTATAAVTEKPVLMDGIAGWAAVLFLGIVASGAANIFQNAGLKYASASHASLVFALEAVFGVVFGVLLLGEPLEARMLAGSVIVFAAIVISRDTGKKADQDIRKASDVEDEGK